jgi:hypothetical protein
VGHKLSGGARGKARHTQLTAFAELCARTAAFAHAFRREVTRVELHPVALLVGGGAEVREAAIEVTDTFVRELG